MIISSCISLGSTKIYISKLVDDPAFQTKATDTLNNFIRQYLPNSTSTLGKLSSKGFLGLESNLLKIEQNKSTLITFSQVNLSLSLFSLLSKPKLSGDLSKSGEQMSFSFALNKDSGKFEDFESKLNAIKVSPLLSSHLKKTGLIFTNGTITGLIKQVDTGIQTSLVVKNLSATPSNRVFRALKKFKRIPKKIVFNDFNINLQNSNNSFVFVDPIQLKSKIGKITISGKIVSRSDELNWNTTVRSKGSMMVALLAQTIFQCTRRVGLNFHVKGPISRPNCQNIGKR